jgi:hypothetical protein
MKRAVFVIIALLALIGCTRVQKNNTEKIISINQNNNTQEEIFNEQINNAQENIPNYQTIEYISFYIFNDLKLEWNYKNIEEILTVLNITENYTIKDSIVKNTIHSGTGYLFLYYIESSQYKIGLSAYSDNNSFINDPVIYRLESIEVKLNESNYLKLFPYKNMKDYIENNEFGDIYPLNQGENNIYYDMRAIILEYTNGDDRFGYANLIFNNGLLESITIKKFTP